MRTMHTLRRTATSFTKDRRGNVTIIFGVSFLPLMLMIGSGVDYERVSAVSSRSQQSLDNAVIAAVRAPVQSRIQVATDIFNANFSTNANISQPQLSFSQNSDGSFTGNATVLVPTTFMGLAGVPTVSVRHSATAEGAVAQPTSYGCLLMLDPSVMNAYDSISASNIKAPNCELHVASTGMVKPAIPRNNFRAGFAAYFESASNVNYKKVCVKGPIGGGSSQVPNEVPNCTPVTNPFVGNISTPTFDMASANAHVTTSAAQPGVYMGNTTFSGTIAPGLYIFKVAPGEISAIVNLTGKVAGNGVTFYFADENVTLAANVSEASTLTAPTSGPYTGILIFMPDNFTRHQTITIQSLDKAILTGLIYTPNWDIDIHSWSESTTNGTWVANTMREDSQSQWTLNPGPLSIGIYADGTSGIAYAPTTGAAPKISLKN